MSYGFRACVGEKKEETTGCDYAGVLMRMRVSFCSRNLRLRLTARALLSALASHQQRAAEIGGKHCYKNPAAATRKGEKNVPPVSSLEHPGCAGGGRGGCVSPWSLASREVPRQGLVPALLMRREGMGMSFCPSALCFAAGSRSRQLAGGRKIHRLNICKGGEKQFRMTSEPQDLLGAVKKTERAKCSAPLAQARQKPRRGTVPLTATFTHSMWASCALPPAATAVPRSRAWRPFCQQTCLCL